MFDLKPSDYEGKKILDCPTGASSFTAEARQKGIEAVGVDPLFNKDVETLVGQTRKEIDYIMEIVAGAADLFDWSYYGDIDGLRASRNKTLNAFAKDYPQGLRQGRYIRASLPKLPFEDGSFDLALNGHFLICYALGLEFEFVCESVRELLRVSRDEVRIFPTALQDSSPYPKLPDLMEFIRSIGAEAELRTVPFAFQKNLNQALFIRHK